LDVVLEKLKKKHGNAGKTGVLAVRGRRGVGLNSLAREGKEKKVHFERESSFVYESHKKRPKEGARLCRPSPSWHSAENIFDSHL